MHIRTAFHNLSSYRYVVVTVKTRGGVKPTYGLTLSEVARTGLNWDFVFVFRDDISTPRFHFRGPNNCVPFRFTPHPCEQLSNPQRGPDTSTAALLSSEQLQQRHLQQCIGLPRRQSQSTVGDTFAVRVQVVK